MRQLVNSNTHIKVDKTTEDIAFPVPTKSMEHSQYVHLDLDILYVNSVDFLLENSRNIGCIHCKIIPTKSDKRVMNGLKSIAIDYEGRRFKVATVSAEGAFKPMIDKIR